ncbi:aldo/keto reductase [Leifsonia sp. YIM 134122]|uniref:Aldo/keto reductase n=1 Tax=Leifsonia stereocauli TaxID=3134136 RepID=A0ABU9W5Y8_9MICO
MAEIPTYTLNDSTSIPAIGLGTYGLRGAAGTEAVALAIGSGYRLLDTALNYENEREVGDGIRTSGIDRSEIVVTSKIPGRHHGYDETLGSFAESSTNLGLDVIDLYLIHWPLPGVDKYVDTWKAMIALRDEGKVRSIGVSNFTEEHLERIIGETGVAPAVNQVELHPYFPQATLRAFHERHAIRTESWSPLAKRTELTREPLLVAIADSHSVTPTQAVLRWHLQLGSIPIPKSADAARQRENLDVFGFELSDDEVATISSLERGRLWGGDPVTHEEF